MSSDRNKEIKMKRHSLTHKVAIQGSRILPLVLAVLLAGTGYAPQAFAETALGQGSVFAADEEGGSLSRIDLATGAVEAIALPLMPHNVDVSAAAGLVFVVGIGGMETGAMQGMDMGEDGKGLLAVLKLDDLKAGPVAVVEAGHHPAHVVPDKDGARVFVTDSESDLVSVIDLASGKTVKQIATGTYPHGQRLSPDGTELYIANVKDDSVSVIDTKTLAEVARIPVGKAPVQVGFTPDGTRVYVSLRDEDKVAVIDRASRSVIATVSVGRNPIQLFATPDGKFVYVADQGNDENPDNRVSVIDVMSNQVVKTITVGMGAHGVTIGPDGRFVFVTNTKDDSVSVIEAASQTVIETIPVGKAPNGIAIVAGH